jgi:hypothetical protein
MRPAAALHPVARVSAATPPAPADVAGMEPWMARLATPPRTARVVIEVDAVHARWLVEELRRVATATPLTGPTAILAACSRATIEGGA